MRGRAVLPSGSWDAGRAVDRLCADYDQRHRRRILLRTEAGAELMLDLAHARHLRDGDGIECEDGAVVRVVALPETLLEITAGTQAALLRLAWHLGNRHLAVALSPGRLLVRQDHVIAEMARGLGASVRTTQAPFDPETGAYDDHRH